MISPSALTEEYVLSPRTFVEPNLIGYYFSCSSEEIECALQVQAQERASGNAVAIGEILIARETISHEALRDALECQRGDRLRRSFLLSSLPAEELARIAGIALEVGLDAGEFLFAQDHHGDSLFIVISGRILLSRHSSGVEQPIAVALPGDVLCESGYAGSRIRSCSAWAIEPSMLLKIHYQQLPENIDLSDNLADQIQPFSEFLPPPAGDRDFLSCLRTITGSVCRSVRRALRVEDACMFVWDRDRSEFVSSVESNGEFREFRVGPGSGIVGEAASRREVIQLNEAYLEPQFSAEIDRWTGAWTRTLMAGPVVSAEGLVVGVLQALNKPLGVFDQEDVTLFRAVAHQFAPAIEFCAQIPK